MRLITKNLSLNEIKTELLVIPVSAGMVKALSSRGKSTDSVVKGLKKLESFADIKFKNVFNKAEFTGKQGEELLFNHIVTETCSSLLFIGWDEKETGFKDYQAIGHKIVSAASKLKASDVVVLESVLDFRAADNLKIFTEASALSTYSYTKYKTAKKSTYQLKKITISSRRKLPAAIIKKSEIITKATSYARDLINMPAADCTPAYFVRQAKMIARNSPITVTVYDKNKLKQMGANALLAVAAGSSQPPYLIKMVYKPRKAKRKVLSLVGKGVTFDSGGLSIKVGAGMYDMKCDMSGAAAVIATMQAVAELKPDCEVRAYLPVTENLINGQAVKPGDVVKSLSKKTIEILNTDAEGRLILADALALADKEKPDCMIDLATLTGACMVGLGARYAALYSNNDNLKNRILSSAEKAGELLWPMPLAEEYEAELKSNVADIKNIGGRFGGSITAALFLQNFVSKKTAWAHMDIAGPAFLDGDAGHLKKGGTGYAVSTLVELISGIH